MRMVDIVKLNPISFRTIYLRREDRVILRTESNRRIVIDRIIPEEWKPYRIYDQEYDINENKRNILLVDKQYLSKIEKELQNR
jgi:hypothetical protein